MSSCDSSCSIFRPAIKHLPVRVRFRLESRINQCDCRPGARNLCLGLEPEQHDDSVFVFETAALKEPSSLEVHLRIRGLRKVDDGLHKCPDTVWLSARKDSLHQRAIPLWQRGVTFDKSRNPPARALPMLGL